MIPWYGFFGIVCILCSYIFGTMLPYGPWSVALNNFFILLGVWLFFDAIDLSLHKNSLIHGFRNRVKYILIVGIISGLFMEFYGAFVSRLWWDPFYAYISKMNIFVSVFVFLLTAIGISYLMLVPGAYSMFRVFNHYLDNKSKYDPKYHLAFKSIGILGIIFLIIPILALLFELSPLVRGLFFMFPLCGIWFVLEYLQYMKKKRSLLCDILELRFGKFFSIIISSVFIGALIEGINLFVPGWTYKNIPLNGVQVFGIPLVILFGWIPLIVIYLSFYNVLSEEEIF